MAIDKKQVINFAIGLVTGAVFFGGTSTDTESEISKVQSLNASSSPQVIRQSLTVEMNNATQSEPIKLVGNYKVEWESFAGDCKKTDVSLNAAWDTTYYYYGTVFNVDGYGKGTSYFYNLDDGFYFLEPDGIYSDTCNWRATFSPLEIP